MDTVAGLRVFVGAVEAGSFSAAGRQLGAAPSSISRHIGDLETALGARLFHRTTRKLSLTEAGRLYYGRARGILHSIDEARLAVSEIGGAPSGILRLSAAASLARLHLAPALAAFHARTPAVNVVLSVSDRVADLIEGSFDLAIRVGRLRDSSLIARKIGSASRVVCASPAYIERAGAPAAPQDLAGHNCLTFRSHPGTNVWSFRTPGGPANVRVSGSLYADNGEALCAAAAAGLGLVLMPEWLVGVDLGAGRLRRVLGDFEVVPAASPLYALYTHQRHLPPKVRAFIDFLAARFAPDYAWDAAH